MTISKWTHAATTDNCIICYASVITYKSMTAHQRRLAHDEARSAIANEYGIPMHYIRLYPLTRAAKGANGETVAKASKNSPTTVKSGNAGILT